MYFCERILREYNMASNKDFRQALICRLIKNNNISDQKTLKKLLKANGINISQGTISRDILELRITKGRYTSFSKIGYYSLPEESLQVTEDVVRYLGTKGFRSLQTSGNLSVIKTEAGYASSIASEIDAMHSPLVLGTVAGYDTILIVHPEHSPQSHIKKALGEVIPELLE